MKQTIKSDYLKIRVDTDLKQALQALATRRGETIADVCRRVLREAVSKESLEDGKDEVAKVVRQVMRDTLKPFEDRLAKINAKNTITSGTAMYMSMQVLEDAGYDSHDVYTKARKKAVALLQEREGESP